MLAFSPAYRYNNTNVGGASRRTDCYYGKETVLMDIQKIITDVVAKLKADPSLLKNFAADPVKTLESLTGIDLMVVGPGIKTGLNIRMDNPGTVGSDLIVGAVAARAKYPAPIAIVDMGTATTVSVVAENGAYIGGMIIPGLWVSVNALSAKAAQLPYIDLAGPTKLLGTNTVDCMRAGAVIGCAAMLDGIIDRMEEELGKPVSAVLTGGVSPLIVPHCRHKFHLEPDILIDGLQILYEKNQGGKG